MWRSRQRRTPPGGPSIALRSGCSSSMAPRSSASSNTGRARLIARGRRRALQPALRSEAHGSRRERDRQAGGSTQARLRRRRLAWAFRSRGARGHLGRASSRSSHRRRPHDLGADAAPRRHLWPGAAPAERRLEAAQPHRGLARVFGRYRAMACGGRTPATAQPRASQRHSQVSAGAAGQASGTGSFLQRVYTVDRSHAARPLPRRPDHAAEARSRRAGTAADGWARDHVSKLERSRVFRLQDALAALPGPAGEHSIAILQRGTLDARIARSPRRPTQASAHIQDEVYVVVRGRGVLLHDGKRDRFEAGDLLLVAAGVEHRFEDFSEDLVVWVLFYGAAGGEVPAPSV